MLLREGLKAAFAPGDDVRCNAGADRGRSGVIALRSLGAGAFTIYADAGRISLCVVFDGEGSATPVRERDLVRMPRTSH